MFIGVRTGSNPRFKKLTMLTCPIADEECLQPYLFSQNALYRHGPVEICSATGGPAGLLLELAFGDIETSKDDFLKDENALPDSRAGSPPKSRQHTRGSDHETGLDGTAENSEFELQGQTTTNDDGDDFADLNDEDAAEMFAKRITALEAELESLETTNIDLQKKCALFIAREKIMQVL